MSRDLAGLGAVAGRVTGRAHVAIDDGEVGRVARGAVLVVRVFHPYFAPVLPRVSGLIVEEGGLLQHAVILAREFGVPTVVGVKGATSSIRPGDLVVFDGATGFIVIATTSEEISDTQTETDRDHRRGSGPAYR